MYRLSVRWPKYTLATSNPCSPWRVTFTIIWYPVYGYICSNSGCVSISHSVFWYYSHYQSQGPSWMASILQQSPKFS